MRPVPATILAAVRRDRRALARLAAWSVAEALPAVLSGLAVARAVDRGFLAGRPLIGLAWLAVLAVALPVGAAGTRGCFRALGALAEPLRDDLLRRVVSGALSRGTAEGTAAVARLTHQVEIVRDTFAGLIMTVRGTAVALAGALIGLAALAPGTVLLVLPPVIAGITVFAASLRATVARQRDYVLAEEALAAAAGATFGGLRDVAACGAPDRAAALVGAPVDAQARAERALARMTAVRSLSLALGGWLPLVLVLAAAPWLTRNGLTAGAVLGTLIYLLHGLHPAMHTIVQGVTGGLRLAVTLDRLLRTAGPADHPAGAPPRALAPAGSPVELTEVRFGYGRHAQPVLDGFSLAVPVGDHLAVVGPSGVGKSTLAGLIAGSLTPDAGAVRVGGVDVSAMDPATLAGHRVLIPQEAYVFTGTVRENLGYFDPAARVSTAVRALGIEPLVRRLGGYGAVLRPAELSAGERQLIALGRAYLSPAPLAILDEATCHLDPATEARVEAAFAARPGALIVVAHRVSSALRARRVLLLDGRHAVLDDHEGLLRRSALYRDLVGHWTGGRAASDPAPVLGDADRVDPGAGAALGDDPGQVVAHRPGR